ncbi:MAG: hypothetical protein QM770_13535 [Tepidisphaeraceae bacterium]
MATDILADAIGGVLAQRERDLRDEQAVYGLDSLDELRLHDVLASGLASEFGVTREVHYPSSVGKKLSHRARCDLVLTPHGRSLKLDSKPATLFDPADACSPDEAMWLEVKAAYQFRGPDERHGGYGAQWRGGVVRDLQKMEAEPLIRHAALLLIVFTQDEAIVAKDLDLFETVLVQKEVLAGFRQARTIRIQDRIGHHCCTAALWPTIAR